jgi:hypothetical protein
VHAYVVPAQVPAEHVSADVHAMPSSHGFVFARFTQPVTILQESSVHTLPSLQLSGIPALHEPPPHTSAPLHAFPSLHGAELFAKTHVPVAKLHVSVVHGLLSVHWLSAEQPGTQSNSSAPMSGAVPPPLPDPGGPGRVWLS